MIGIDGSGFVMRDLRVHRNEIAADGHGGLRHGSIFLSLLFPPEHVGAYQLIRVRNVNEVIPIEGASTRISSDAELCLRHIADSKRSPLVECAVIQAVELCVHGSYDWLSVVCEFFIR